MPALRTGFVVAGRDFAAAVDRLDFVAGPAADYDAALDAFDAGLDAELPVQVGGAVVLAAVGLEIGSAAGLDNLEVSGSEL